MMGKLNQILQLQDNIRTECKSILNLQSKTMDDPKLYVENQALLNSLFVQHMELGLRATSILAMENLKSADDNIAAAAPSTLSRTESNFGCCYGDESVVTEFGEHDASLSFSHRRLSLIEDYHDSDDDDDVPPKKNLE